MKKATTISYKIDNAGWTVLKALSDLPELANSVNATVKLDIGKLEDDGTGKIGQCFNITVLGEKRNGIIFNGHGVA